MTSAVKVELQTVSFSPVARTRADSDIWAESINRENLDARVTSRFENYVRRIAAGGEKYAPVHFVNGDGKFLRERLKELTRLGPEKKALKRRKEIVQELSNRLCDRMNAAPVAASGAIFVIEAQVDQRLSVALLKLDLGRKEVVSLKGSKDLHDITFDAFDRALPEEPSKFRKGVLFPSPSEGDALSGQHDGHADYWELFVGAEALREMRRNTTQILDLTRALLREEGRILDGPTAISIIESVAAKEAPSTAEIAEVILTKARLNKRPASVRERAQESLRTLDLRDVALLESITYEFRDGLKLDVPAGLMKDEVVTISQEDDDVIIRIKESQIQTRERVE